jgi:hypothetical protein
MEEAEHQAATMELELGEESSAPPEIPPPPSTAPPEIPKM